MDDYGDNDFLEDLQELVQEYKNDEASKSEETKHFEVPMEKVIFGDRKSLLSNMAKSVKEKVSDNKGEWTEVNQNQRGQRRKPVWVDDDDEHIQIGEVNRKRRRGGSSFNHLDKEKPYKEHLTKRFERVYGTQPNWAKVEQKKETDVNSDDEELLRTVGFLEKPSDSVLLPHELEFKRLQPLNRFGDKSEGPIISIQFHPTSTAALVAAENGYANIYAIDGRKNEKLHSIFFRKFQLRCVRLTPCGNKAIFGSTKQHYYSYDLLAAKETRFFLTKFIGPPRKFTLSPCGRYMGIAGSGGHMHLYDINANELIHSFKQEGRIVDLCFTSDSKRIICSSNSPYVHIFSLQMRRREHSFLDEGCVSGNVVDLSLNQRLFATGSKEGIVNVYDFDHVKKSKTPQPIKTFLNLTTAIASVKFNPSSDLLAMGSMEVPNAVRLAHFPSGTVYSNFPGRNPELGQVRTIEFSPGSGYLAMGSQNRSAYLYRLKHFNNY